MDQKDTILLWALENVKEEPMCEDPQVMGHCDFTFEMGERDLCPCEWRVMLQAQRKSDFETGFQPVSKQGKE